MLGASAQDKLLIRWKIAAVVLLERHTAFQTLPVYAGRKAFDLMLLLRAAAAAAAADVVARQGKSRQARAWV